MEFIARVGFEPTTLLLESNVLTIWPTGDN